MRIAVVDVAAETSGALSVLKDFHAYVYSTNDEHEWTFYTSVVDLIEKENIHLIKIPWIKKSWMHRIAWEFFFTWQVNRNNYYDVVISLQNKAIHCNQIYSVAYFHNMLLIQDQCKFSLIKKDEMLYAVYNSIIAPITIRSLRKADLIICQTETAKKKLNSTLKNNSIVVIPPKVELSVSNFCFKFNKNINRDFFYPAVAHKFKNHDVIVKAVRYLVEVKKIKDFNVYFTFHGNENEYAKKILNMSNKLPQIKFIGYLPRESLLKMYYINTMIITSKIESYPIPLVEAMSIGTPIVAIGYDYVNEITIDYDRKYICLSDDYKDLAEVMLNSMKDIHYRNIVDEVKSVNGDSMSRIINEIKVMYTNGDMFRKEKNS